VVTKYPQQLINVRVSKMVDIDGNPDIAKAVADVEQRLGSEGRVLLRPSGTEPVIRVMVEGRDATLTKKLAQELAAVIEQVLAA
jgi:phosphoglucosamine mutase